MRDRGGLLYSILDLLAWPPATGLHLVQKVEPSRGGQGLSDAKYRSNSMITRLSLNSRLLWR